MIVPRIDQQAFVDNVNGPNPLPNEPLFIRFNNLQNQRLQINLRPPLLRAMEIIVGNELNAVRPGAPSAGAGVLAQANTFTGRAVNIFQFRENAVAEGGDLVHWYRNINPNNVVMEVVPVNRNRGIRLRPNR